jgi:hypothetical protein
VTLARATAKKHCDPKTVARVAAEFREMPGLSVRLAQAARLFDLPGDQCSTLFEELRRQGLIEVTPEGVYRRPSGE